MPRDKLKKSKKITRVESGYVYDISMIEIVTSLYKMHNQKNLIFLILW